MTRPALYERSSPPWQSSAQLPDGTRVVQIAFNKSGIPFWRAKRWFETDKGFTQWMPLAKCATADEAFAEACKRLVVAA
jgi:hypothetical protein